MRITRSRFGIDQLALGFEHRDQRAFAADQRARDVEAAILAGKQLVEVVTGDAARDGRILLANQIGVVFAQRFEMTVNVPVAAALADALAPSQPRSSSRPSCACRRKAAPPVLRCCCRSCPTSAHARRRSCCRSCRRNSSDCAWQDRGPRSADCCSLHGRGRATRRRRFPAERAPSARCVFTSSTPCMYFDQSITMATLQHWPARLVPPPRDSTGAPNFRAGSNRLHHILFRLRNHDADWYLAIVGGVHRIHCLAARVKAHLAFDVPSQLASRPATSTVPAERQSGCGNSIVCLRSSGVMSGTLLADMSLLQAAYRSASARFSSSPIPGRDRSGRSSPSTSSGKPSKNMRSMRT